VSVAAAQIRNFGIVAHINAGKTTLGERILYDSGRVRFLGEVDEGTAALDYLPQEQRRGISIRAASTSVRWRDCLLNLIDTPGHVDFGAEVARTLRVLDGAVLVLDGVRGVESQTEAVWRQLRASRRATLAFVNKLDRPVADWARVLDAMRTRLGARVVPAVVPLVRADGVCGLVELIGGVRHEWGSGGIPALDLDRARLALVEAAADHDPAVMDDFVLDRPVDSARLRAALRRGVVAGDLTLAFAGSALCNRGVELLLDGVCDFLPAPIDCSPVRGLDGSERAATAEAPVCALVFRASVSEAEPALAVRVYSGALRAGTVLERSAGGRPVVVQSLARMHAEDLEPMDAAGPGDIVAVAVDATDVATGTTLFTPGHPITLAPVQFPQPVLAVAIEPRHAEDAEPVAAAARRVIRADPTLALRLDEGRGVFLLAGLGELHLEVAAEQIRASVGDRFRVGKPEVACRETVRRAAVGQGEWRLGEPGGRGLVQLDVLPAPGQGAARVRPGAALRDPELGARLADMLTTRLASGLREGWPAADLEVVIQRMEGEGAPALDLLPVFVEAAEVALRRALAAAEPVVLHPMVRLEVHCPHDALSAVLGDLRGKGVDLEAIDADGEQSRVSGSAPLVRMLGYTTRLRSLTRGLGSFHLEPAGFAPLPGPAGP
jgi:elongation factor G